MNTHSPATSQPSGPLASPIAGPGSSLSLGPGTSGREELFGPYQLVAHLGRGGMADVYKARCEDLAGVTRIVAVKRILREYSADPNFIDLFVSEAKLSVALSHPNIIHTYNVGVIDGQLYMALEYVAGSDLSNLLRLAAEGIGPLPSPLVAAHIAREIAKGLAAAHEYTDDGGALRPIVHCDISPHNVILGRDGQVKILDFGIARALRAYQERAPQGVRRGKLGYMAPEMIRDGATHPLGDIFAVGVVLHELLTGRRLFRGADDAETVRMILSGTITPPSQLREGISKTLDRITLTAMASDPQRRYQRAATLARDLDLVLQEARFSADQVAMWVQQLLPARSSYPGAAVAPEVSAEMVIEAASEATSPPVEEDATPALTSPPTGGVTSPVQTGPSSISAAQRREAEKEGVSKPSTVSVNPLPFRPSALPKKPAIAPERPPAASVAPPAPPALDTSKLLLSRVESARAVLRGDVAGNLVESAGLVEDAPRQLATVAGAVQRLSTGGKALGLGTLRGLELHGGSETCLVRVRGDQLTLLRIEPSKPIREAEQALEGLP